jgi:hypothetical protein
METNRRRFRFSLRTIFVTITVTAVLSGWFVWNVNIVHRRKAALAQWGDQLDDGGFNYSWIRGQNVDLGPPNKLSALRTWLSDAPLCVLQFRDDTDQTVLETAARLFPEAKVIARRNDPWEPEEVRARSSSTPYVTERAGDK